MGSLQIPHLAASHQDACPKPWMGQWHKGHTRGFQHKINSCLKAALSWGDKRWQVAAIDPNSLFIIPSEPGTLGTSRLALCRLEGLLCSRDVRSSIKGHFSGVMCVRGHPIVAFLSKPAEISPSLLPFHQMKDSRTAAAYQRSLCGPGQDIQSNIQGGIPRRIRGCSNLASNLAERWRKKFRQQSDSLCYTYACNWLVTTCVCSLESSSHTETARECKKWTQENKFSASVAVRECQKDV